jgi:hypothetical protein
MLRTSLVVAAALMLATFASAAPVCVDSDSLADYIALGEEGCMIGDKVFSDFSYVFSGTGTTIPSSAVTVTTDPTPLNPGVIFNAPWFAAPGTIIDVAIGFTVTGPNIKDASIVVGGLTGGFLTGAEDLCLGDAWDVSSCEGTELSPAMTVANGSLSDSIDWFDEYGPVSQVGVFKDITLENFTGSTGVSFSLISQNFSQVPEPSTLLLMGGGLLALGLARRRAIRNRS